MQAVRYVPALPAKPGALKAVRRLRGLNAAVQPLWTIPPPGRRCRDGTLLTDSADIAARLRKTAVDIDAFAVPCWVDAGNADDTLPLVSEHLWTVLATERFGCAVRPVTGPERDTDRLHEAGRAAAELGNGLAVRVRAADCADPLIRSRAGTLLEQLDRVTAVGSVDLLLDLGEVHDPQAAADTALGALGELASLTAWRTIAVLAGSFPWGSRQLKRHDLTVRPRVEWAAWRILHRHLLDLGLDAAFGDYSTVNPRTGDAPITPHHGRGIYEKPRYTVEEDFLIGKGAPWAGDEPTAMPLLTRLIVNDAGYRPGRTEAETWLADCAAGRLDGSRGNPELWVMHGHMQHVAFTADQVRRLDEAAA